MNRGCIHNVLRSVYVAVVTGSADWAVPIRKILSFVVVAQQCLTLILGAFAQHMAARLLSSTCGAGKLIGKVWETYWKESRRG